MQFILSEHEMKRGCELLDAWTTEPTTLDSVYTEQVSLNEQGYFTVIHCVDVDNDLYIIKVFERNE